MQELENKVSIAWGMDPELLEQLRKMVGYPSANISELAREFKVSRSKLSRVLSGRDGADFNTATLVRIARDRGYEVRLVKPRAH